MNKDRFQKCGIVPVVVLNRVEDALPLARALLAGGIDVAELTFRTDAAEPSIRKIAEELPEMYVGAGTVVNLDQLDRALDAGAKFIVSPGYDEEIVAKCKRVGVDVFPGVVSPSEIMKAMKDGVEVVKFFPAGNFGGLDTIKSLSAPFPSMRFMPTGGINIDNLADYLSFEKIHAVGGSWICHKNLIDAGKWDEITDLCKEARRVFEELRG